MAQLKIVALEPGRGFDVIEAQFNPKDVQVDINVPWAKQAGAKQAAALEFTGREPRTVSLELMFDASEQKNGSVGIRLRDLEAMIENHGELSSQKRPPRLRILFGQVERDSGDMPDFDVVLETMSVKRTMFSNAGRCIRALVTCKFKEAGPIHIAKPKR